MQAHQTNPRRQALEAAKLAVRAYVREPSEENATEVENAWRQVRRLQGVLRWRQPHPLDGWQVNPHHRA